MLKVFYGRESLDKEKFIFDSMDRNGRNIIIVPDQFTLEMERDLFASWNARALMDTEVISMSRLGQRLLSENGGATRSFVDKYGRHMLLSKVIREQSPHLEIYGGMSTKSAFIDRVNDFISEMKQYNCSAEELKKIGENSRDGYFSKKIGDLALIYQKYNEEIQGKYTDTEDKIDLYLGKISESRFIAGAEIWIYGFDSFAPKALSLVGELARYASDVNLVLTGTGRENDPDRDLFTLTDIVRGNLKKTAKSLGVEYAEETIPALYEQLGRDPEIRLVERSLFAAAGKELKSTPAEENRAGAAGDRAVVLVQAATAENEAEVCATYVMHLVRDMGYRFRDIKLILNDTDSRAQILRRMFAEYGLTVFTDENRSLADSSICVFITSLMDVLTENFRTEILLRILKSGFMDLTDEEVCDLENYALQYRIRFNMWEKDFEKTGGRHKYTAGELNRINDLRRRALAPVLRLKEIADAAESSGTNGEFISSFYVFLRDELRLKEKISRLITDQEKLRPDLAEETAQIWNSVINILDQIKAIAGAEPFKLEGFAELLKVGLRQVEIGMLPPTEDCLVMGTMQRTRIGHARAVLVLGADAGVLPAENQAGGILAADERRAVCADGAQVCKVDDIMLMEERLGIYRNMSKPLEHLYVSRSTTDPKGEPTEPSEIFLRLGEILGEDRVMDDSFLSHMKYNNAGNTPAGLRHLTEAVIAAGNGGELTHEWREVLDWYHQNDSESLSLIRQGICFNSRQEYQAETGTTVETCEGQAKDAPKKVDVRGEEITPELRPETGSTALPAGGESLTEDAVSELYYTDEKGQFILSPSGLERYSRCPFSYFINYGLKPEELQAFEINSMEVGNLYHSCLMELARELTNPGVEITAPDSQWMTVTEDEITARVEKILEDQVNGYNDGLLKYTSEEEYKARRIKSGCVKVCRAVVDQVRAGKIKESFFEQEFRRGRALEPIRISCGDKTVLIEGKIDRMDILPDNRVKIIDYKTGSESFHISEAEQGARLQLMLYLEAAIGDREVTGRKPAGVFYFHAAEPKVNSEGVKDVKAAVFKEFKMDGVLINDPEVIEAIAGEYDENSANWNGSFSSILKIRNGSSGFSGTGRGERTLLGEEEFENFEASFMNKIGEIAQDLKSGRIPASPMKLKGGMTACTYCGYKGICRFDTVFEGCGFREIKE